MAIYHLSMSAIQRSAGRSAAASAAYRSGEKIHDPRQAVVWSYPKRADRIIDTYISTSHREHSPTRQALWAAVENHHKRGDAVTAREIEIALPHEITEGQRVRLARAFADMVAYKYGVAVDCCVHKSKGSGENWHAHLLLTSVSFENGSLGKKAVELDPIHCKRAKIQNPADELRPLWTKLVNEELERNGIKNYIDHRSLMDQGVERIPQIHVGPVGSQGHRQRKTRNDQIKELNREFESVKNELTSLSVEPVKNYAEIFDGIVRKGRNLAGYLTDADVRRISYAVGQMRDQKLVNEQWIPWIKKYTDGVLAKHEEYAAMAKTPADQARLLAEPQKIYDSFVAALKKGAADGLAPAPQWKSPFNDRDNGYER